MGTEMNKDGTQKPAQTRFIQGGMQREVGSCVGRNRVLRLNVFMTDARTVWNNSNGRKPALSKGCVCTSVQPWHAAS